MYINDIINNQEHCKIIFNIVFGEGSVYGTSFLENKYGIDGVVLSGMNEHHCLFTIFNDGYMVAEECMIDEKYIDAEFNCFKVVERLIELGYKRI